MHVLIKRVNCVHQTVRF